MPSPTAAVSSLVGMAALMLASTAPSSQVPRQLTTPAGFELSIYADSVVNAREMVRGPNGTLFVGTLRVGTVHALVDSDGDHTVPFYTGRMFPASYRNAVIVALQGSWNRSTPSGYRVMVARTGGRRVTSYEPLVDGFFAGANAAAGGRAAGNDAIGRRADVMQLPDGSILISDDSGNRIYRLSYRSASAVPAQGRSAITINDTGVQPENVTSSADGSVYFGSMLKGTIYRAVPGATQAEPWLLASEVGLTNVLGVLAHDASNTLWVCQNSTGGRGGAPVTGQTALRSFNLTTGTPKDRYDFPSNGGVCNDIAVGADGTVYATESFANRIHRLRPGATALDVWFTDAQIGVIDGIALLSDGAVYVNGFNSGRLFRVPVRADGSAGALEPITTSLPLTRPDGLRSVGPMTLLQAEQGGRLAELRVTGARAEVRVIRDSLPRASGVTLVGGNAMVLVELSRAVVVPYPPR
jgi:sugar lactone lactonase YvrE